MLICVGLLSVSLNDRLSVADEKTVEVTKEIKIVSNKFNELSNVQHRTSEITQLMMDEGFKKCVYNDSLKIKTIGFGHKVLEGEKFKCITHRVAIELLRKDYDYAANSVDNNYPWAYGEVRLVLINMTYQMGQSGVSKFLKTLSNLRDGQYDEAAIELLDSIWAEQTPNRALRLAGRIMSISVKQGVEDGK